MNDTEMQEVRAVLADLQAEIRRHRIALGETESLAPPDPLLQVRERQVVNPHLPIGWPVMPGGVIPKLTAYAQKITRRLLRWYINPIVAQQNEYNLAATDLLASLQGSVETLTQRVEALEARADSAQAHLAERMDDLYQRLVHASQASLEPQLETMRLRLQRLENWRRNPESPQPVTSNGRAQSEIDSFLLGALFRNRVQMAPRLGDYDDIWIALARAQAASPMDVRPVLDLGCGRGEVVAHLCELGLPAYGIDLDEDALLIGREAGLDLRRSGAFEHLDSLPDNSLAAVVMIQVIEHFMLDDLARLFLLIERKLVPGGLVLAETLNPACLYSLSNWYLLDPSHQTPVHSQMARFLLEQAGLHRVEIRFMHPVPPEERLQAAGDGLARTVAQFQADIERLNQFLYGPQDYAAIAYKPES